jgi:hypothetical protein
VTGMHASASSEASLYGRVTPPPVPESITPQDSSWTFFRASVQDGADGQPRYSYQTLVKDRGSDYRQPSSTAAATATAAGSLQPPTAPPRTRISQCPSRLVKTGPTGPGLNGSMEEEFRKHWPPANTARGPEVPSAVTSGTSASVGISSEAQMEGERPDEEASDLVTRENLWDMAVLSVARSAFGGGGRPCGF